MKWTSRRRMDRGGHIATQNNPTSPADGIESRHGRDEGLGVRVPGKARDGSRGSGFDDVAEIHDRDALAEMFHYGEIVRNEQVRQPPLLLQVMQQVDHLRLHGDIQSTDRFIADDEPRLDREGPGDADPLALAPAEFMGKSAALTRIESHVDQQPANPFAPRRSAVGESVNIECFANDLLDGQARIKGASRVLKDHLEMSALLTQCLALKGQKVMTVESDATGGGSNEPDNRTAKCGFAATALPDQPQGFTCSHLEVDAIDGLNELNRFAEPPALDWEPDLEIGDFEEFHGSARA